MPTYRSSVSGAERTTANVLGYPWIEIEDGEPVAEQIELAERTADAILLDVGTDADKAQAALDAEQQRETPRVTLTAKLERIVRNAES